MTSTIGVKKIQHTNGTQVMTFDTAGKISSNVSSTGNITTTGTVNTPSINGGQIGGRRNIVINGAMQVAQRGNQNTSDGANTFGVDRFLVYLRGGAAATVSKDTDVPSGQGFSSSCKIDITTGDALGVANDLALFRQLFEGQDLQQLKKGTSNAEKVTVSFWIKSTVTGTYILELDDVDNTRAISKSYTVNSSNTWEHKTITFEGDTTGAFDNDNANSLRLTWALGAGSDFQGVTLATSWASTSDGDARYEGQVNAVNSDSNNIYFTGIQMEIGSQATSFEHRSFAEELALCQRYFEFVNGGIDTGMSVSTSSVQFVYRYRVDKRASATAALVGTPLINDGTQQSNINSVANTYHSFTSGTYLDLSTGTVNNNDTVLIYSNSATVGFSFDAEL